MADAPPPGPPPPRVPEGWKAVWNAEYKEWFYVNTFTKASQWDKPTEPAVDPKHSNDSAPPAYMPSSTHNAAANEKNNPNNPYNQRNSQEGVDADARLAAKLQAEENARSPGARPISSSGTRGASDSYYNSSSGPSGQSGFGRPQNSYPTSPSSPNYPQGANQGQAQGQEGQRGFLGKLLGKSNSRPPQYGQQGYPQQGYSQGYNQGPYPPQNQYPPQGQYYQQGYPPPQQYYGPPPPQQYQQQPQQKQGIGMGGALLGAGAGLVGGALLMDAFEDHEQFEEQQAYQQGEDQGYDQGYDQGMDQGMDGGGDF